MKHEGWGDAPMALPDEQLDQLEAFESLLRERAVPRGMIAAGDALRIRRRHVEDCLRAAAVVRPGEGTAYDLGSGAGLPGVVVAIACPQLEVTLVEARRARAAILEFVVERLGLPNVHVAAERVERLKDPVDLCFARAFADPASSWRAAERILRPQGRLVYFGGTGFQARQVPEGVVADIITSSALARSGPLVIMSRQ